MTTLPAALARLPAGLGSEAVTAVLASRPAAGGRAAAVLSLLSIDDGEPSLLFVERASTLRNHAGQVAFPGGSADPGDASSAATALREAEEEVAVDPASVDVLGELAPVHVAVTGFDVTTVVGWWRDPHPLAAPDPGEVASATWLPVRQLADPAHRFMARHPSGYRGPGFCAGGLFVWGLTAHLTDCLLLAGGWSRAWDTGRERDVPTRLLTDRHRGVDAVGADRH